MIEDKNQTEQEEAKTFTDGLSDEALDREERAARGCCQYTMWLRCRN